MDPDRAVRWIGQYGFQRFFTPAPRQTEEAGTLTWTATGHQLTVEGRDEPCQDAMSGEPYTHTVNARVDSEELDGCGGWMEAPA